MDSGTVVDVDELDGLLLTVVVVADFPPNAEDLVVDVDVVLLPARFGWLVLGAEVVVFCLCLVSAFLVVVGFSVVVVAVVVDDFSSFSPLVGSKIVKSTLALSPCSVISLIQFM